MDSFIREPYRNPFVSGEGPVITRITYDGDLPVPLDDLKLDLRVDDDDEDDTLERMERTAMGLIEARSGMILQRGQFEALFDACTWPIQVMRAPLVSLDAVAALTAPDEWTDGETSAWRTIKRARSFELRPYPGYVAPTFFVPDLSFRVTFTAGFKPEAESGQSEADDPPLPDLYRGVLIALTGHFYENRELFEADKLTEIASTAGGLLNSIRQFW